MAKRRFEPCTGTYCSTLDDSDVVECDACGDCNPYSCPGYPCDQEHEVVEEVPWNS